MSLDFDTLLYNADGQVVRVSIGVRRSLPSVERHGSDLRLVGLFKQGHKAGIESWVEDIDTPGQRAITASAARRYDADIGDEGMDAISSRMKPSTI